MRAATVVLLLFIGTCVAQKRYWTTRRPWTTSPWRPWTTRPWRPWTTRPWRPWTTSPWRPWTTRPWRPWTTRPWWWTTRRPWWTTRPWRPWTTRPWRPWTTRPWRPWTTRPWWRTTRRPWWTTRPWCPTGTPWTTSPPSSSPRNGSCNFDYRPCQGFIRQDKNDNFDWSYNRYGTPSSDTGPSGDHTTGRGRYMYAEASWPRKQGDRARLTAHIRTNFPACVFFHFHMYGAAMGTLRIYLNHRLVWQLHGNQGNQWIKGTFPVIKSGFQRIDIDAIVGSSYTSDIALDDLGYQEFRYLSRDRCDVTPSCADPSHKPSPPTTYPPYTTYQPYTTYPPYTTSYPNYTLPPLNVSCGRSPVSPWSRVIGGKDAPVGAWPWQTALYVSNFFFCGGSLISPNWVVTAAHCIYPSLKYRVVLGDHNRSRIEGPEQSITVSKMIVHPNWNRSAIDSDIALLKLSRPAMINNRVRLVCLPRQDEYVPSGGTCYITGWGKIRHPGNSHHTLQQATLPVVDNYRCQLKLSNSSASGSKRLKITRNMICGGVHGVMRGGCHGDSGGPYVCQARDGRWVLQGAVSWGSPRCDALDRHTVFARVSRFRNWIDHTMRTN